MKYKETILISDNDTASKIFKQIKPGSTVLEFGCATGRMTKFLNEYLRCKVYILEIDEEGYGEAIKYAENGFCGDVETLKWIDTFKNQKFDYILFADVLEHLRNPEKILKASNEFLKDDGKIILSVPNIAHNSILLNLYENKFNYTSTGLLDNTHIRFFTYYSLIEFCESGNFKIVYKDGTVIDSFCNEQKPDIENTYINYYDAVFSRPLGEYYQYIFVLQKKDYVERNNIKTVSMINPQNFNLKYNIYYNDGTGFSEENSVEEYYKKSLEDYCYTAEIKVKEGVNEIRFDPIEGAYSVCSIDIDEKEMINEINSSAFIVEQGVYFFDTKDPCFLLSLKDSLEGRTLHLTVRIEIISIKQLNTLLKHFESIYKEKDLCISNMEGELEKNNRSLEKIKSDYMEKEIEYNRIIKEKEAEYRKNISDINCKLEEQKSDYQKKCDELLNQNDILRDQLYEATDKYNDINSAFFWKITKPARIISDCIQKVLNSNKCTCMALKGIRSLKKNGFSITLNKTKKVLFNKNNISEQITETNYNGIKNSNENMTGKILNDEDIHKYISYYQDNIDFSEYNDKIDTKLIAFYLPQFHTFPENDEWWGKGFTEWTNTRKALPRFKGHYQPREPHDDIGYYDLSKIETLKKQAKLVKQHGIYGLCLYYYWFSGKKLMETPIDLLMEHPEIDLNFCLCWANENWTRTWDGLNKNILIEQKYREEDIKQYIVDIKPYVMDSRYIKINGKPIFMVYNPSAIPDCKSVFEGWRKYAIEEGIGEISIWICKEPGENAVEYKFEEFVDKMVEFPPRNMGYSEIVVDGVVDNGYIFDYSKLVDILKEKHKSDADSKVYRCAMMGWDNSARRKTGYTVFDNFNINKFYEWVKDNICESRKLYPKEERFTFINAWNEWAEGTCLEPDKKYGYSNINAVSSALCNIDFNPSIIWNNPNIKGEKCRLAVQAHVFYPDLMNELTEYMNNIPEPFDCYITTNDMEKAEAIFECIKNNINARKAEIFVAENRGRDVAPFIIQLSKHIFKENYEYFCHIHTKKSKHFENGDEWRHYLLDNLLGSKDYVKSILDRMDIDNKVGLIYPKTYPKIETWIVWGENIEISRDLMNRLNLTPEYDEKPEFPAGNMFWARTEAVKQMFEVGFKFDDFPEEAGQLDLTLAHAIERSWYYIAKANGYKRSIFMKEK